jgi:glucose-6-phosphate isomerase
MSLPKINPTQTKAWQKLQAHFNDIKDIKMTTLFAKDSGRSEQLRIIWDDFFVDYSKNRLTPKTLGLLNDLAEELHLDQAIKAQFKGEVINETENRKVLHTALRASNNEQLLVDNADIIHKISEVKGKIQSFTNAVASGEYKGYTGKPFTDIVNVGVGGSDLGPSMVVESLQYYKNHLKSHFVSNIDGDHVNEIIKKLNPETTLFIIVSKSFSTLETLTNANTLRDWFISSANKDSVYKHFIAVSSHVEKASDFGISKEYVFPMWDWVGGRFSLWSAVGLSISLAIGYNNFDQLLCGANKMDSHFKNTAFKDNIPVTLALISLWYNNFFNTESEAVIAYSQYLNQFTKYLQQGVMESNGKSIDRNGNRVNYQTGTIVWGDTGTNSQHAFFQLIHQGTKLIPTDFIGFAESLHGNKKHHDFLMANFIAQTEALMNGRPKKVVVNEAKTRDRLVPFKVFEGNKPTNSIIINKLTPESLGKLIALYEHKIFVQGVLWNIFSYDQFGVELGKELANNIIAGFDTENMQHHDASTQQLIAHFKKFRSNNK